MSDEHDPKDRKAVFHFPDDETDGTPFAEERMSVEEVRAGRDHYIEALKAEGLTDGQRTLFELIAWRLDDELGRRGEWRVLTEPRAILAGDGPLFASMSERDLAEAIVQFTAQAAFHLARGERGLAEFLKLIADGLTGELDTRPAGD